MNDCRVYHFHDTSSTARVQQFSYIGNDRRYCRIGEIWRCALPPQNQDEGFAYHRVVRDGAYDCAVLRGLRTRAGSANPKDIILNWKERESDIVFGPHQFSDGTLRAIFLLTLLLQPEQELPRLIIIDEPELGLHPYALNVVASLVKMASHHCQASRLHGIQPLFLVTISKPEDVIVVDRQGKESMFKRLSDGR